MPSFLHEAIVEMLRSQPELVLQLLRKSNLSPALDYDKVEVVSADLGVAQPPSLAADVVVQLKHKDHAVLAVVIEVQLSVEAAKWYSWPAYAVSARSRYRCDAMLVVVTPYKHVARWAAKPIVLGPGLGLV